MTKIIPILSGRCLVVELPEGATKPEIYGRSLTFDTPIGVDEWGYDYQAVKIPEGNWRIIGMLSEVTEEQIIPLVDWESNPEDIGDEWRYRDYQVQDEDYKYSHHTALESLESAIIAEGYYLDVNPLGSAPKCGCTGPSDKGSCDGCDEFIEMQSRVLCRSRCLLLGREDV